jgi:hypothetical protein
VTDAHELALTWLTEQLSAPSRSWIIGEALPVHLPSEELRVGRCRLRRSLPSDLPARGFIAGSPIVEDLRRGVILTDVEALDAHSAYWRAREHFSESRAIPAEDIVTP